MVWRSATCCPASSTDRAAISTIAPRIHTDRRDAESGRCNGLNRPSRPRASSLLTQSFMATSIHAENSWQPPPTAQSGPRHSMSGSRRRALSIRRDQQCNPPPGPTSPLEVNVTLPLSTTMPSGRMMGSLAETIRYMIRLSRPPFRRRLGLLACLLFALAACSAPVKVDRVGLRTAYDDLNRTALSSDQLSEATRTVLRRAALLEVFDNRPDDAITAL